MAQNKPLMSGVYRQLLQVVTKSLKMLDDPLCGLAVPLRRDRAFLPFTNWGWHDY